MLEGIFGNKTAEKVLFYIVHHGEGYALAISKDMKLANTPVVRQLDRFERAQILASKQHGKTRVYSFNDKFSLTSPVKELVQRAYNSLTLAQKKALFVTRRRPRAKNKKAVAKT